MCGSFRQPASARSLGVRFDGAILNYRELIAVEKVLLAFKETVADKDV